MDRWRGRSRHSIRKTVRSDDIVCRLGGDEFLTISPNTDLDGGMHIAELICQAVSKLHSQEGGEVWRSSVSVGVAVRTPDMKSHEDLLKAADKGVYEAKRDGKNCVRTIS